MPAGATYTKSMKSCDLPKLQRFARLFAGAVVSYLLMMSAFAAPEATQTYLSSGKKLVSDAKCEACHASKRGGDGSSMYSRQDRRVTTKSQLLSQVGRCNNELNLGLFPDDEAAIATYLNATHYKFKD